MTLFSTISKSPNGSASVASPQGKPADALSRSDKIALGVGLGVPLASLIVGILGLVRRVYNKRNHVSLDGNSGGSLSG